MKVFGFIACIVLFSLWYSCKLPYNPIATGPNTNYLVVEGMINTGNDSTIIKLSRTVNLANKVTTKAELNAVISIENDANGTTNILKPIKTGVYAIGPLNLSKTARYRLRIHTYNGSTYLSDFTPVKESPPIDSLSYDVLNNGLYISANTHDATNNSRYYRWEYVETWKFESGIMSYIIVINDQLVNRDLATQDIHTCWASNNSPEIVLGSSARLVNDIMYKQPIITVPFSSEKVKLGYSILVKQYALTEDAFNFWQNLKKNTEQLGSIFDAQPSQIQGNIYNVNDKNEPVFGYISAGTVQQKRLTVLNTSWPGTWGYGNNNADSKCTVVFVPKKDYPDNFYGTKPIRIPLNSEYDLSGNITGYLASSPQCVDCTLRGTNKKPADWP